MVLFFCTAFQNPSVTPKSNNDPQFWGIHFMVVCLFSLHLQPRRYLFFNLVSYVAVMFEQ